MNINQLKRIWSGGTFSADIKKSSLYEFLVVSGLKHKVPNNWLKHHGYPMNRR